MTDYREQCNTRKTERHTKAPELDRDCIGKHKRKKSKRIKIIGTPKDPGARWFGKVTCLGKYERRQDAENALTALTVFWDKYYTLKIEEPA